MGIYCYPRFSGLRRASGGSLPSFHVTLIRKGSDSCRELHQNHTDGEVVRTDKTRVDGQIRTRTSFSLLSQTRKQTQYIKHSSLCPTPRTHLPAINGAYLAATKEGVPPPSVCSLPRQHLAPRCQMSRTRGQELACSHALWLVEVSTVHNRHPLGRVGPGSVLALRQHPRKAEPIKDNMVTRPTGD